MGRKGSDAVPESRIRQQRKNLTSFILSFSGPSCFLSYCPNSYCQEHVPPLAFPIAEQLKPREREFVPRLRLSSLPCSLFPLLPHSFLTPHSFLVYPVLSPVPPSCSVPSPTPRNFLPRLRLLGDSCSLSAGTCFHSAFLRVQTSSAHISLPSGLYAAETVLMATGPLLWHYLFF